MNTASTETKIFLPGVSLDNGHEAQAKIRIERAGQQPPSMGDKVVARVTLTLPCFEDSKVLRDEIIFENRVMLFGFNLHGLWGYDVGDGTGRYQQKTFAAATWVEAFQEAQSYAMTELGKLLSALEARAKALEAAEQAEQISAYQSLKLKNMHAQMVGRGLRVKRYNVHLYYEGLPETLEEDCRFTVGGNAYRLDVICTGTWRLYLCDLNDADDETLLVHRMGTAAVVTIHTEDHAALIPIMPLVLSVLPVPVA